MDDEDRAAVAAMDTKRLQREQQESETGPVAGTSKLITFRDGTVASLAVLERLWAIEARGGIFVLTDNGGYDIEPEGILTVNERVFLLGNQEEARRLVRLKADDSHLTDATAPASSAFASG